jgi:ADP-L-glycero-D-manno-heptose 6-epimerase
LHFNKELQVNGKVRLFAGTDGYADGEQLRDFIYVEDVVAVNLWFWQQKKQSGIYNLGTGRSETFNAVAREIIAWHKKGNIEYIPFPEQLRGSYQSFTQADISKLRAIGYDKEFKTVTQGVKTYLDWLNGLVAGT